MEAISPHFDDGITNTQLELLVSIGHQGKEIHHNSFPSWKTIMMNSLTITWKFQVKLKQCHNLCSFARVDIF